MCVTMIVFGVATFCLCGCVCCMIFSRVMDCVDSQNEQTGNSNTEMPNPMAVVVKPQKPVLEDEDPVPIP